MQPRLFSRVLTAKTIGEDGEPFGEGFLALADDAAKIRIKLKRSQTYLDNLGIVFDDEVDEEVSEA